MTNASEARRLVELRKSAEKSSIASLKSMLTTSKNRIEEIKNEEFEADAQFQKIVYSHLKDSVTTSTVRSIVNDYELSETKRKKLRISIFAVIYGVILVLSLIFYGRFDSDSIALLAVALALGMPILQIFLSEFIQSAKPDDSVQLLKLIAEMQLDTKARDIDGSTNSIPPKMVADWRDMLLVIQNKDVMSWKEQKSTRELENKTEVKEARLKLENAKKRVARAMEEHEVILDVYSQRVGIGEEDNEAE